MYEKLMDPIEQWYADVIMYGVIISDVPQKATECVRNNSPYQKMEVLSVLNGTIQGVITSDMQKCYAHLT